jgi:hypothetical protein
MRAHWLPGLELAIWMSQVFGLSNASTRVPNLTSAASKTNPMAKVINKPVAIRSPSSIPFGTGPKTDFDATRVAARGLFSDACMTEPLAFRGGAVVFGEV